MSKPIDHIAYLSQEIGPRPAGTEEEQQSALYITDRLQKEAHLAVNIEDFSCNPDYTLPRFIYLAVTLVCAALGHFVSAIALVMTIIAVLSAAAYIAEMLGFPLLSRLFNKGVSQNVVAKYTPEMTDNQRARRRRKIVVVANYDSGKVRADYHHMLIGALHPLQIGECVGMVAIPLMMLMRITLFRTLSGAGAAAYTVLMVILLLCILIPIVFIIMERVAPYNESANNNAAGVAVMLEVARRLGRDLVPPTPGQEPGLIHDEETARKEGLVPEGADIVYEDGQQPSQQAGEAQTGDVSPSVDQPVGEQSSDVQGFVQAVGQGAEQVAEQGAWQGDQQSDEQDAMRAQITSRVESGSAERVNAEDARRASADMGNTSGDAREVQAYGQAGIVSGQADTYSGAGVDAGAAAPHEQDGSQYVETSGAKVEEAAEVPAAVSGSSTQTPVVSAAAAMPTAKVASNVPEWYRIATEKARKNIAERGGVTEQITFRSQYADVPVTTSDLNATTPVFGHDGVTGADEADLAPQGAASAQNGVGTGASLAAEMAADATAENIAHVQPTSQDVTHSGRAEQPAVAQEPELPMAPVEPELPTAPKEPALPTELEPRLPMEDEPMLPSEEHEPKLPAEGHEPALTSEENEAELPAADEAGVLPVPPAEPELEAEPLAGEMAGATLDEPELSQQTPSASASGQSAKSQPLPSVNPGNTAAMPPLTDELPYEEHLNDYTGPSYVNAPAYPEEDEEAKEEQAPTPASVTPHRATKPLPMYYTPPKDRSELMRERAVKPRVMVSSDLPDEDGYVVDRLAGQRESSPALAGASPATGTPSTGNGSPTTVASSTGNSSPTVAAPSVASSGMSATPANPATTEAPTVAASSATGAFSATGGSKATATPASRVQMPTAAPVPPQGQPSVDDQDLGATVAMLPITGYAGNGTVDATPAVAPRGGSAAQTEAAPRIATPSGVEEADLGATVAMPPIDMSAVSATTAPSGNVAPTPGSAIGTPMNQGPASPQTESQQTEDINVQRSASATQVMDPVFGRQRSAAPASRPANSSSRITVFEKLPDINAKAPNNLQPLDIDDLRHRGMNVSTNTRGSQHGYGASGAYDMSGAYGVAGPVAGNAQPHTAADADATQAIGRVSGAASAVSGAASADQAKTNSAAFDAVSPDDISENDVAATSFDDYDNEPVYADDPEDYEDSSKHSDSGKKHRGGFFSRFRRNKKKDEEKSMTEELGLDKNFNAREEGKKITWDDLADDDWQGGAFSNLRGRFASNDDQHAGEKADTEHTRRTRRGESRNGTRRGSADARERSHRHDEAPEGVDGGQRQGASVAQGAAGEMYGDRTSASEMADVAALAARMEAVREEQQGGLVPPKVPYGEEEIEFVPEPVDEVKQIYSFANGSVSCEVWFVGLGSQYADNQGMKAFLAEHADEMRGAVVINLEALGRGDLRYVEKEGVITTGTLSARLKRIVRRAAQASGMSIDGTSLLWRDDAASYAQKHRLQAVTLVGVEDGKPALLGDAGDAIENIDEEALNRSADMVIELIKNI